MKTRAEMANESSDAKALAEDEVWIEFLETELDDTFEQDLSLLLMNSQLDKRNFETIKTVRDLIKSSDDVSLPEDGRIYDRMHANVMAAIADKSPGGFLENTFGGRSRFLRKLPNTFRFSTMATGAALSALVAIAGWFSLNKQLPDFSRLQANARAKFEAKLFAETVAKTDSISEEVLDVKGEDEFVNDAASRKIASMSDQDYEALLEHLRK